MAAVDWRRARLATMKVSQPPTFTKGPDMNFEPPPHLTGPTPLQEMQRMHQQLMQSQAQTNALLGEILALLQQHATRPAPPPAA